LGHGLEFAQDLLCPVAQRHGLALALQLHSLHEKAPPCLRPLL
jgi:hypothetical protein